MLLRKKGGNGRSVRVIYNPDGLMRSCQYRILTKIFNQIELPDYIWAFEAGKSIPEMASIHVNKGTVISLDLKDFFHSIHQRTLANIFVEKFAIGEPAAKTLSELCTYKFFVPQGALTSPKLSNIVTYLTFGPLVEEYCRSKGLSLSIYADDITVSCDEDLVGSGKQAEVSQIITDISEIVTLHGFRINRKKTKVMRRTRRQYVCGVVVNQKTNMLRKERYKLRAMVHSVCTQGLEATALRNNMEPGKFFNYLQGRLNWLSQLNPSFGIPLKQKLLDAAPTQAVEQEPSPVETSPT